MFNETKVKLIIEAATDAARGKMAEFSEEATQGLQKADKSARSFGDGIKEGWAKAKSVWVEITGAVLALKTAYDMANQAAKFKEREQAFFNMAASHGANAEKIIRDLKEISRGTIDTMTLMEKAGTAMTLGIAADKIDDLMKVARASAKITGQTVSEAFSDISLAVGRQSKMILDNLGILVNVESANEKYAQKLGKLADSLTEAEKKQAFLNATLEAGEDIVNRVGNVQDSAAERIQRYEAQWKNAAIVLGKVFLNVAQGIELVLTGAYGAINRLIEYAWAGGRKFMELWQKLPDALVPENVKRLAVEYKNLGEAAKDVADKSFAHMSETWDSMTALWEKTKPMADGATAALQAQAEAAQKTKDEITKLIDLQKSEEEKRAAATKEMYAEAGLNADAYYREEVNQLAEKVRAWQAAGVSIEDSNAYLFNKISALEEQALKKGEALQAEWVGQLKWHTDTLVEDLIFKEQQMQEEFASMAAGIEGLNKSEIGIHVRLYDDGFVSGVDQLIAKLSQLQAAQASYTQASVAASEGISGQGWGNLATDLETYMAGNIKYGRSELSNPLGN